MTLTCLAPHVQVANMTWFYQAENERTNTKITEEGAVPNSSINFQPILESANGKYTCVVKAEDGKRFNDIYELNATECQPNYYGKVCNQVCDCHYGGTCDRWEGCLCPPGRRGDRCEHTCAPGTYGWNCSMSCYCENIAPCDAVNGSCICAEGRSGEFCQIVSSVGNNQAVVVALASVLPTIAVIVCIVTVVLIKRRRRRPNPRNTKQTDINLDVMETLSSWEVDKEDIISLEHMIGEGEFGHVVRGKLRVPQGYQILVAAKSIRPDRMTASAVRDFRREMDILARIHEDKEGHPNVVKFHGVVTKSEPQYIFVEYAMNEDLLRYLWNIREERKITGHTKLLERLNFAHDVASGLSELARLKIVHRDIAARNVVISDRKVAKIADFGLSRDVYVSSAYKRTNQGGEEELLPLKWMALESLRDGVYTCESDVWSYGVLLWEIVSFGEEPRYAGGPMHPDVCTLLELLRKGVRLQQPENCSQPLYRIIRSCWVVDPSKRPTPEELLDKIDQLKPPRHAAHLVNHDLR
ncbi:tyrosine-protein kinase receptor Tie-1-like [Branchiostoma floridae]|uniref:receptor protein-tyrosine kinase n=1 Tax=Branchiostoma floridae TaxID=7739 RepID=A0A9J7MLW5_BRAFL|nr:tyrosine-protein kinase receptor Tie-1-like [Branchiostoma floridae]